MNEDLYCIVENRTNYKLRVIIQKITAKVDFKNQFETGPSRSEPIQTKKCGLTFGPDRPRPVYFQIVKPRPVQFSDQSAAGPNRTFAISSDDVSRPWLYVLTWHCESDLARRNPVFRILRVQYGTGIGLYGTEIYGTARKLTVTAIPVKYGIREGTFVFSKMLCIERWIDWLIQIR